MGRPSFQRRLRRQRIKVDDLPASAPPKPKTWFTLTRTDEASVVPQEDEEVIPSQASSLSARRGAV